MLDSKRRTGQVQWVILLMTFTLLTVCASGWFQYIPIFRASKIVRHYRVRQQSHHTPQTHTTYYGHSSKYDSGRGQSHNSRSSSSTGGYNQWYGYGQSSNGQPVEVIYSNYG